ncbi:MAG: SDR family oxidoreductase [Desulfurococcales archaeon]|nr:SDR family oxidoreductase [Desulfurococcales archaeon]
MDLGLKGKIALVTAGSKGLGFASAMELAREGALVIIASRSRDNLKRAADKIRETVQNAEVDIYQVDLTNADSIEALFSYIKDEYGKLDILVYSTGGPRPGKFFEMSDEDWEDAYKLLAMSAIRVSRYAAELMKPGKWGRIVYIASLTLLRPHPNIALSNVMRMPIAGLVRTLALELAKYNITVNAVLPSLILTDRVKQLAMETAKRENASLEEVYNRMASSIPLGRLGTPEEIGSIVAFLASEKASFITGSLIPVDGGALLI